MFGRLWRWFWWGGNVEAGDAAATTGGTFRRRDTARTFARRLTARAFARRDTARVFARRDAADRAFARRDVSRTFGRRNPAVAAEIDQQTLAKGASESVAYLVDFSRVPEWAAGETLSSPSVPAVSGLTIGSPSVTAAEKDAIEAGAAVQVTISGGTADTEYQVKCYATFSGGSIRSVWGRVAVK